MKELNKHIKNRDSGFSIPESYFDTFEASLQSKIRESKFPKKAGFEVPKGYFENFEVPLPQKPKARLLIMNSTVFKYAVAASLIIGFLTTFYWISPTSNSYDKIYNKLSAQEISNWLENNDYKISSSDMVAVYGDDLNGANDLIETKIDLKNIENYLNESPETENVIGEFY